MKSLPLWLALLSGCCMTEGSLSTSAKAQNNVYSLSQVAVGMNERCVLSIMGKPYEYETIESGEDLYDVWYYVTRGTGIDQSRMVRVNLTPLVFKNGCLVGWGYVPYDQIGKSGKRPSQPKEEGLDLEKTLNSSLKDPQEKTTSKPPQEVKDVPPPPPRKKQQIHKPPASDSKIEVDKLQIEKIKPPLKNKVPEEDRPHPWKLEGQPSKMKSSFAMARPPQSFRENPPETEPKEDEEKPDERDRRMIDESSDQDFDFW